MSRQVNLGQIVPNIQIGTTTTGNQGTQASVTNVGTSLNPILNFTIPKGGTGDSGVYIGTTEPTNNANVWIDTSGEETPYAEGVEF